MLAIEDAVRRQLARVEGGAELRVVCEIGIGSKAVYSLASRPELAAILLQSLLDELQTLATPEVQKALSFAIEFEI